MEDLLKDFEKKHQDGDRPVFVKSFGFYLDSLNAHEFKKMLDGLEEEIEALKRETEETNKIKAEKIKYFQQFMGTPDQHFE